MKAYSLEEKAGREQGPAAALPFGKRAVELDANFALAYKDLGVDYYNPYQRDLAQENIQKAFDLRERTSEREKLAITATYYTGVTGQVDEALQTFQLWGRLYPRDDDAHGSRAFLLKERGRHEEALAEYREAAKLGEGPFGGSSLIYEYMCLNRFEETKKVYEETIAKIDDLDLHAERYHFAFLEDDSVEMEQQVAWAHGKPNAEAWILAVQSYTEARRGHLKKAREYSDRAGEIWLSVSAKESAAISQLYSARRDADFGESQGAYQDFLTLWKDADPDIPVLKQAKAEYAKLH